MSDTDVRPSRHGAMGQWLLRHGWTPTDDVDLRTLARIGLNNGVRFRPEVEPASLAVDVDDVTVHPPSPSDYRPPRSHLRGQWKLSEPYRTNDGRITAYWARPTATGASWCGVVIYYGEAA